MQPAGDPLERIERELAVIVRRAQRVGRHGDGLTLPLDRATYWMLGRLHGEGPMRLSDLAGCVQLDTSTVSRQVAAAVQAGLIQREADQVDGRAHRLRITSRGEELLMAAKAARRQVFRQVLDEWPPEDQQWFASLLERFNAGLAQRFDEGGTAHTIPIQNRGNVDS